MPENHLVFIETDDGCALCGIRGQENLTVHHIDQNPSNAVYENEIVLCHNCHHRYHSGKGISLDHIVRRKRHLVHKTLTQYGVNAIKIAYRKRMGVPAHPFLLHHLTGLGYLKQGNWVSAQQEGHEEVISLAMFTITDRGRRLYEQWLT